MPQGSQKLPFRLSRYKFIETLGKGTQGAVYLAELDAELGFRRKVAVKIVGEGTGGVDRAIKSLANEARALAAAHHPNVVQVYDLARVDGQYLLVMEYVEGPTLTRAILHTADRGRALAVGDALRIAEQLADGLACVHSLTDHRGDPAPMIHRDLKPGNIILSRHGVAKLVDFGLAKGKLVAFHTVVPNVTRGTPAYMSPEQVRGEELTPGSDQFSLGAVIFEMLTGVHLFSDDSELALLQRVAAAKPSADPDMLRQVCPDLFPIVVRCLSPSPVDRYATTAELAVALRNLRRRLHVFSDIRGLVAQAEGRSTPPTTAPQESEFAEESFMEVPFSEPTPPRAPAPAAAPPEPADREGGVASMGKATEMFFFPDGPDTDPEQIAPAAAGGVKDLGEGTEFFFFGDGDGEGAPELPTQLETPVPPAEPIAPPDEATVARSTVPLPSPGQAAEAPHPPAEPCVDQGGTDTESFFFEDLRPPEAMEELSPPPTPDTGRRPKFKDLMSRDVSFRMAQPRGKQLKFSKPKTHLFGPSNFDMDPVEGEVHDSGDDEEEDPDDGAIPPWER
jgi:eukaryotic-like serine/threonine-protein kinase